MPNFNHRWSIIRSNTGANLKKNRFITAKDIGVKNFYFSRVLSLYNGGGRSYKFGSAFSYMETYQNQIPSGGCKHPLFGYNLSGQFVLILGHPDFHTITEVWRKLKNG